MTNKKHPLAPRMPSRRFPTMRTALADNLKYPVIGVTQGGSSRKNSGARVAATDASAKPPKGK